MVLTVNQNNFIMLIKINKYLIIISRNKIYQIFILVAYLKLFGLNYLTDGSPSSEDLIL